jgi:ABC-2 type transport system ATP-binding protein
MANVAPYPISTHLLTKRFNDVIAVNEISFEIVDGEIFGLLGPNGAGKTTSIKMITGLLKPDSGEVYINGNLVNHADNRQNVGICPQEIILWNNLTCLEQLCFIASMYNVNLKTAKKRAIELLDKMGLNEKAHKLVKTLSGGMQRRMNIIMALMNDPDIVVLDEPEAGLDPQGRVLVRDFIRSLAKVKTVIFSTHNMDEADRLCNRIGIIDQGKLLVLDTPDNLKKNIGKGDVLEIEISGIIPEIYLFNNLAEEITISGNCLFFRSMAVIDRMPSILEVFKQNNIPIVTMNLRKNTLEDVFISLTGKNLRE